MGYFVDVGEDGEEGYGFEEVGEVEEEDLGGWEGGFGFFFWGVIVDGWGGIWGEGCVVFCCWEWEEEGGLFCWWFEGWW